VPADPLDAAVLAAAEAFAAADDQLATVTLDTQDEDAAEERLERAAAELLLAVRLRSRARAVDEDAAQEARHLEDFHRTDPQEAL
jgi:hypothetical protein